MKPKIIILAGALTHGVVASSDELILRSGEHLNGTYYGGSSRVIRFATVSQPDTIRQYAAEKVKAIYLGDEVQSPAPATKYGSPHLSEGAPKVAAHFNPFLNYAPVWTESIDEAIKWGKEEIDDEEELDTMLAKQFGEFVPFEEDRCQRDKRHHMIDNDIMSPPEPSASRGLVMERGGTTRNPSAISDSIVLWTWPAATTRGMRATRMS